MATNLFGRGMDIERVNIVFNYDMPEDSDTYLHRVRLRPLALTPPPEADTLNALPRPLRSPVPAGSGPKVWP